MITKTDSNCSFKANIKSTVRVADKTRLNNIKELFSKGTINYPEDTLYLTRGRYGNLSVHTTDTKNNDVYVGEEIFTNSLKEIMAQMSDEEIAKKLISAFKVLRLSDKLSSLNKFIKTNNMKLNSNKLIAENLRNIGRDKFAEKYDMFAKFNEEKIASLNNQFKVLEKQFNNLKNKESKHFPELSQINY